MDKLKMHSPDFTEENIAKLADLFPNCVTEAKGEDGEVKRAIDFDLLRQELSGNLVEGPQERYRLDWPGKREALALANAPIAKTLRPCREESVDFETTKNLFIEGDNLDALKLLQETYLGQVKMIYIDPPYNTGNDFIYDDNYSMSREDYKNRSGETDEKGNAMFDEEKWRKNSSTRGRYHSEWTSMMYPRLRLAKNLLKEDGVLLISIDDHEAHNLRKICDEIFGEENMIAQLVWEKGRKNDAKLFSVGHEYILLYARSIATLREKKEIWREEKPGSREIWEEYIRLRDLHGPDDSKIETDLTQWYSDLPKGHPSKKWSRYRRIDSNGPWRDRDISWPGGDGPKYDVIHPKTKKACAVPERGWIYASPEEMQRQIKLGLVEFREDHTEPPFRKAHIRPIPDASSSDPNETDDEDSEVELATQVRGSYFYKQSQVSVKYLRKLMGAKVFTNPKDHEELSKIIKYVTPNDEKALIIDFFAGSGSTAEAVFRANSVYGSNHRFILVQLPESLEVMRDSTTGTAKKTVESAIRMMKKNGRPLLLPEVAKERLRRAGVFARQGQSDEAWEKDTGFRVLKIDSTNLTDVYYQPDEVTQDALDLQIDNVKPDRTPEDLLFQVLLDWGVDLGLPITEETIEGKRVFFVSDDALAACFDTGLTEGFCKALAKREPLRAVFRDAGYATDSTKINIEQIFNALSPHTELKTI